MTRLRALPPVPAPEVVNAVVEGWHDGDTVNVWVHRGGSDYSRWAVRLRGAACLELREPGGVDTYVHLAGLVPTGSPVVLLDPDEDKYGGRKLATVVVDLGHGSVDLVELLIADGWALPWDGRGPQPKPAWPRVETLAA